MIGPAFVRAADRFLKVIETLAELAKRAPGARRGWRWIDAKIANDASHVPEAHKQPKTTKETER